MLLPTAKKQMRKLVAQRVGALDESAIREQSAAVAHHLFGLDAFVSCCTVSLYLSMKGEICTWPIVERLFAEDKSVFVPQVCARRCATRANLIRCIAQVYGSKPPDMRMLQTMSLDETRALPLDRWGIPTPPEQWATARQNAAASGAVDLVLVPCVAFDSTCQRLGHGRGYYGQSARGFRRAAHSLSHAGACASRRCFHHLSQAAPRGAGARARGHGRPVLARANRRRGPRRRRRPAPGLRGPSRRRLSARRAVHAGRLLLLEPARARSLNTGLATHTTPLPSSITRRFPIVRGSTASGA